MKAPCDSRNAAEILHVMMFSHLRMFAMWFSFVVFFCLVTCIAKGRLGVKMIASCLARFAYNNADSNADGDARARVVPP